MPVDIIKGAAITGASLSLVAGQGLSLSGVAAVSAAYLAVTPGKGGDTARLLGEVMWKSATTAADLYKKYECGRLLSAATTFMARSTRKCLRDTRERTS